MRPKREQKKTKKMQGRKQNHKQKLSALHQHDADACLIYNLGVLRNELWLSSVNVAAALSPLESHQTRSHFKLHSSWKIRF